MPTASTHHHVARGLDWRRERSVRANRAERGLPRLVRANRLRLAVAEALDYIVATDHDFVVDYARWIAAAGVTDMITTAVGVEATTASYGHFNVWPLVPDNNLAGDGAPKWQGLEPPELLQASRADDPARIVQCNHPWFEELAYFKAIGFDAATVDPALVACDTIEVVNAFTHEDTQQVLEDWLALLGRGMKITPTGVSDRHRPRESLDMDAPSSGSVVMTLNFRGMSLDGSPLPKSTTPYDRAGPPPPLVRCSSSGSKTATANAPQWVKPSRPAAP